MEVDPSTPQINRQKNSQQQQQHQQQQLEQSYNSSDECNLKLSLSPQERIITTSATSPTTAKPNGTGPKIIKSIRPTGGSPCNGKPGLAKPQHIIEQQTNGDDYADVDLDNPFKSKPKLGFDSSQVSPLPSSANRVDLIDTVNMRSPTSPNPNAVQDEWETHKKRSSSTRKSPTSLNSPPPPLMQQQHLKEPVVNDLAPVPDVVVTQASPNLKQISSVVSSTTDISSVIDEQTNAQQNPQLQLLISSSSSNSSNTTSTSSLSSSNKDEKSSQAWVMPNIDFNSNDA